MSTDCCGMTEIIHFKNIGNPDPYGVASDGLIVFPNHSSENKVELNDVWRCDLVRNSNAGKKNYFATPIEKIEERTEAGTEEMTLSSDDIDHDDMIYLGADTIYCRSLTGRYDAYRSFNGRNLHLIQCDDGNVLSKDCMIKLSGLSDILQKEAPCDLEYVIKDDSILIKLQ